MQRKKIFNKKSKSIYIIKLFLIILFLLIIIFYLYYKYTRYNFFIIPQFEENYYIIPKDKGGKKVLNVDKKSLHLNQLIINNNILENSSELFYSIQFFVSSDYDKILLTLNNLINNYENIYKKEDFYVATLKSELGIDYFLLYKNFNNREEAQEHCSKYLSQIDNCLIVNVQNF